MSKIANVKNHVLKNGSEFMTSAFGYRNDPITGVKNSFHGGIDVIRDQVGVDFVIAFDGGKVITAKNTVPGYDEVNNTGGNYIVIDHGQGLTTRYLHLKYQSLKVKVGDTVKKGDLIAFMGSTGYSTGAHLHFEVRKNNERVDPMPYLLSTYDKAKPIVSDVIVPKTYIVVKGDTLSKIARQFGTNVKNLVALNEIKNANLISVGQIIKI